jgi:glycopeptide antibiotics resistance protein
VLLVRIVDFNPKSDLLRAAFVTYIAAFAFLVFISKRIQTDSLLYNFIPLHTISEYLNTGSTTNMLNNLLGNIMITMPFGFFRYISPRRFFNLNIIVTSLSISILIELVQALLFVLGFGTRSVDVDDVILNSLGITLGFLITKVAFDRISTFRTS